MSVINKKYQFRGLDTRANKLYRQEGTASDCRNVFTDSNNNLIKRPDFEALNMRLGLPSAKDLPDDIALLMITRDE